MLLPTPPIAVHLLSLRAQLQQQGGSNRPLIAATLNEGGAHDGSRCCAVAWVPRSGGSQFLVAHASGNILVYKKVGTHRSCSLRPHPHKSPTNKPRTYQPTNRQQSGSMMGEAPGKLLSMPGLTSTRASGLGPCQTITVPSCGGVNDAAFNPDGNRLAAACRDGSVRLLDWPSGQCVAGFRVSARVCVVGGWS